ncbi:MAG: aldehyde dehydrogenase family protein, partial [Bacilli bacterium]|nr:aldehyde dehydrogenase family protein [Bacilli bacterium]
LLKKEIEAFFPNKDYSEMPVIINEKHFNRLKGLLKDGKIFCGGKFDDKRRFIEPTVIDNVDFSMPIMKEEIFGPILPVITYDNFDEALIKIKSFPKPLAFYLFTMDNDSENKVLNNMSFGGGCINDTIVHLATSNMGFGGVGDSGMGSYHGKESFDTFTHYKSILKKSNKLDLNMRYHPYSEKKFKVIKRFMK